MMQSRTVREGSVGLFALLGLILFGAVAIWVRGGGFGQKRYDLIATFDDASGLQVGGPVRFRGVTVGKIVSLEPNPQENRVDTRLEISSTEVRIPRDVLIQASRYGLIGEASVDITPQKPLSEKALAIDPLSSECQEQKLILCNGEAIAGDTGAQLVNSLIRLSKMYSDPEFINNLNAAVKNAALTATKIAKLSDELSLLSSSARQQISGVSGAINSVSQTANRASQLVSDLDSVVITNQATLNQAIRDTSKLISNLNGIVADNRGNFNTTIASVEKTSDQMRLLAINLQTTANQVNTALASANTQKMLKDVEIVLANAAETSTNLRDISKTLNDPATLLALQKTLNSARVTFENAQKITSDVDDLTGDPAFRNNIRRLIDGLSALVSVGEQLDRQIQTAQVFDTLNQNLTDHVNTYQRLHSFYQTLSRGNREQGIGNRDNSTFIERGEPAFRETASPMTSTLSLKPPTPLASKCRFLTNEQETNTEKEEKLSLRPRVPASPCPSSLESKKPILVGTPSAVAPTLSLKPPVPVLSVSPSPKLQQKSQK
jgi:phospholipid/cholesterol/gamma-HCH transport system substrate-binding protein